MRFLISFAVVLFCQEAGANRASLSGFQDKGLKKEVVAVRLYNLTRIQNYQELRAFIAKGLLQRIPNHGPGYILDRRVGSRASVNRVIYRYARPYTVRFVKWFGKRYDDLFHRRFRIPSAVRTCAYQKLIAPGNINAVSCEETSHTTGATIDISYSDVSPAGRRWMEKTLLALEKLGQIQATREIFQPVYHIMVYPTFSSLDPR